MSDDLRSQILANLSRKETDELVEIWITNDRVQWSGTAYDAIESILKERLDALPLQNSPIVEYDRQDPDVFYDARLLSEKSAHPRDTPVFYRPSKVLWLAHWLNQLAPIAVLITAVISIPSLFTLHRAIASYSMGNAEWDLVAWIIALSLGALAIALQCGLIYFALRALAAVLKILMEMEFSSRAMKMER